MTFQNLRKHSASLLKYEKHYEEILAKHVMTHPIFLYEDDSIETIIDKLKEEDISYCVVVDYDQNFIGEISEDTLIKVIAHESSNEPLVKILDIGYKRSINYTNVADYVKRYKNIVHEDTRLFDIMKLIDKKGFQYIPVVDKDNKVLGIITPNTILRFIVRQ